MAVKDIDDIREELINWEFGHMSQEELDELVIEQLTEIYSKLSDEDVLDAYATFINPDYDHDLEQKVENHKEEDEETKDHACYCPSSNFSFNGIGCTCGGK